MEAINGRRQKSCDYVVVRSEQVSKAVELLCSEKVDSLIY